MNSEAFLTPPVGWQALTADGVAAIEKEWRFADFHQTMAFVNAVAQVAHRLNHHPDMHISYARCVLRYTTHDAGGLTALDMEAAAAVDALLQGRLNAC